MKVMLGDKEHYMDGYMKNALDTAKKEIKKDWDMIFLYDGNEGSGKSAKALQDAFYCDPTLDITRVVFTPNEFRKAIMEADKFQAVVYDEAYTGLSSRATMSLINRTLIKMLAEIRQKNLFIFVVMPTFFDLDKYVALWRSRALVHVYCRNGFERGYFSFYNSDKKKNLYILGKKFYSYSKVKPNFIGRFTKGYILDEEEYRKKKKESLVEREKTTEEKVIRDRVDAEMFEKVMALGEEVPHPVRRKLLAIPKSTYYFKLKQYEDKKLMESI